MPSSGSETSKPPSPGRAASKISSSSAYSPKSLNAFAVNQLSHQGYARGPAPRISNGQIPPKYQSAARRVTLALVAAPIALVTSYLMYDRVVRGNERKKLVALDR